jgi:hypothetical protein
MAIDMAQIRAALAEEHFIKRFRCYTGREGASI